MELNLLGMIIVVLAAAIPPILYMIWVRNTELCDREGWFEITDALAIGALGSLALAYLFETLIITVLFGNGGILPRPFYFFNLDEQNTQLFIIACIIAPLVEEATKALGISYFRDRFTELENGFIYGAVVGLGFAAMENVLYGLDAYVIGAEAFVATVVLRALTSTLLHASSSAIVGYGMVLRSSERRGHLAWWPYYLLAVVMHSTFNLFAVSGDISGSAFMSSLGLAASFGLVLVTFGYILGKIRDLDRTSCNVYDD